MAAPQASWLKAFDREMDVPCLDAPEAHGVFLKLRLMAEKRPRARTFGLVRVQVQRGQAAVSVAALARKWGITRKKLTGYLKRFQAARLITFRGAEVENPGQGRESTGTRSEQPCSLVSICNYDLYYPPFSDAVQGRDRVGTGSGQQERRELRGKRDSDPLKNLPSNPESSPTFSSPAATDDGPAKPVKAKRAPRVAASASFDREFDEAFWPPWVRKVGKQEARKAFVKARKRDVPLATIMDGSARAHAYWRRDPTKESLIHPATWLNNARWEDELPAVPGTAKPRAASLLTPEPSWPINYPNPLYRGPLTGDDDARYRRWLDETEPLRRPFALAHRGWHRDPDRLARDRLACAWRDAHPDAAAALDASAAAVGLAPAGLPPPAPDNVVRFAGRA